MSIRTYFVSLMKDKRNGVMDTVVKAFLHLLSFIYGAAVKVVDECVGAVELDELSAIYRRILEKLLSA